MNFIKIVAALAITVAASGCDALQKVGEVLNLTQCEYEYNSISDMSIAGIDVSNGISIIQTPQILALLTGSSGSVPLDFNLNLDVTNPNDGAATMSGMDYILSLDDIQFTTGSVNEQISIPAGGKRVLPLQMGFDAATLLTGETAEATTNILKNIVGIGDTKTKVRLDIRPTITVGTQKLVSPIYIPITFEYGGRN